MRRITQEVQRRKEILQAMREQDWLTQEMAVVRAEGKAALDECTMKMGQILVEAILYTERERMAGAEYHPSGASRK